VVARFSGAPTMGGGGGAVWPSRDRERERLEEPAEARCKGGAAMTGALLGRSWRTSGGDKERWSKRDRREIENERERARGGCRVSVFMCMGARWQARATQRSHATSLSYLWSAMNS